MAASSRSNFTGTENVKQALCVLFGSFMLTMPAGALAQSSFPEKPVRIVVGFVAGGKNLVSEHSAQHSLNCGRVAGCWMIGQGDVL